MRYKEFLEYLEANLDSYHTFINKAINYQQNKNEQRQKKARWENERIEKAAYEMWKKAMENLYNNLKHEIKSDMPCSWTNYIAQHEILESVNESINDMDFSDNVA